jgi:hypothetical protein
MHMQAAHAQACTDLCSAHAHVRECAPCMRRRTCTRMGTHARMGMAHAGAYARTSTHLHTPPRAGADATLSHNGQHARGTLRITRKHMHTCTHAPGRTDAHAISRAQACACSRDALAHEHVRAMCMRGRAHTWARTHAWGTAHAGACTHAHARAHSGVCTHVRARAHTHCTPDVTSCPRADQGLEE